MQRLHCHTAPAGTAKLWRPSSLRADIATAPGAMQPARSCCCCQALHLRPQPPPASAWGKQAPVSSASSSRASTSTSISTSQQRSGGKGSNGQKGGGGDDDDEEEGWGLLDSRRYSYRWQVPWSGGAVAGGMVLWFVSFVAVGIIAVPGLYRLSGVELSQLGPVGQAQFTLACQSAELVVGLAVVRLATAKGLKEAGPSAQSDTLFNFSPKGPFTAPRGWATWALLGLLLAPLVVGSVASLVSSSGYDSSVGGRTTVDGVVGMVGMDLSTYLSLLVVTGVMAPVLEETVFRGFLLTSLTRWLPTWAAVGLSSLAFGAAHFSPRDLPSLVALGSLLGVSYVRSVGLVAAAVVVDAVASIATGAALVLHLILPLVLPAPSEPSQTLVLLLSPSCSRNLLTPILIHGVWNSVVLTLLFGLAASGVDVESALVELR
ncbi:hypothetical protein QJQ45_017835 [Haematococcus lacustris]|nr:hypothetical protein QJQ45_017835 [Haematococcus lacustris]